MAEDREREQLKRKLGLVSTAIAKGGGMPQRSSREEVPRKDQPRRDQALTEGTDESSGPFPLAGCFS